jgi:cytochrome c oxidase cbb3-type subunit 3
MARLIMNKYIRSLALVTALSVAAAMATGCARLPDASAGGARTVSPLLPRDRSVINQPLGPVPGQGELAPVANPLDGDRAALAEGRLLFVRYNCAGCHGGRAGGGMGPSLRDPDWLYGSSPDRIFNSIAQGRGHGMPAWGARLPEQQIWEMTAYVSSLRTPQEPEAPP